MDLIHEDSHFRFQDWKLTDEPDHLIRFYRDTNLVVIYYRPGGYLRQVLVKKLHNGVLIPVKIPYWFRINSAFHAVPTGTKVKYLMSTWPFLEESHILLDPGSVPRLRKSFRAVLENNSGKFVAKLVDNKLLQINRLETDLPYGIPPTRRTVYCRNSREHEDYMSTGPMFRCYILNCPCGNRGYIGHCDKCGNVIHECIYPGCYYTFGSETTWHKNIKQYKYFMATRIQLAEHFKRKHGAESPMFRTAEFPILESSSFEQVTPVISLKQILENDTIETNKRKRNNVQAFGETEIV